MINRVREALDAASEGGRGVPCDASYPVEGDAPYAPSYGVIDDVDTPPARMVIWGHRNRRRG
jgi:hypothetical protein